MTTGTPAEYGAAYLDEHYPGWAKRIELSKLDLSDPCRCVLGQLFSEGSVNGYTKFSDTAPSQMFLCRLGFDVAEDVPADLVEETWECLDVEWSCLIADRQSQTTLTLTTPQEVLS